ncbi:MAG: hypothetical protein F4164_13640 [Gemmatimonadales bacterium]|nr:hypothetical protein [Gemmatimonadales bacterium]MYG50377.1 hypothetical protein [Gemmatimonadales bacterium]MYK00845.1 hypothetical protein [Candidatus Palauibacter ramosifaciens]
MKPASPPSTARGRQRAPGASVHSVGCAGAEKSAGPQAAAAASTAQAAGATGSGGKRRLAL